MRTKFGGIAALVVGALMAGSCGGGGGGAEGDPIDPTTAVDSTGDAPGQHGGAGPTAPSSAAGAAGTTPGAAGAAPGGAAPGAGGAAASPAGTAASAPPTTAPAASSAGATLVPLYTYPTDPSWDLVIAAKAAHPTVGVVAVINPANGPGAAVDPAYASGITRLNAAGITVLGYVATGYAVNSPDVVKANIDRWRTFYPGQIGGIFFDEQSVRAGDVPYYRDLSQYAKAQGLPFTVGNPGTDTDAAYVGALDMMLIYENAGLPTVSQLGGWHANHAPSNFGVIPHAAPMDAAFVREARRYVRYIYLQNDTLPNPWDTVPATFNDLLAALE
jgi:hypothetical protein